MFSPGNKPCALPNEATAAPGRHRHRGGIRLGRPVRPQQRLRLRNRRAAPDTGDFRPVRPRSHLCHRLSRRDHCDIDRGPAGVLRHPTVPDRRPSSPLGEPAPRRTGQRAQFLCRQPGAGIGTPQDEVSTAAIDAAFGSRPVIYKAGRYGVGPATAQILHDLGYLIDLSVVPHTNFGGDHGPNFHGCPDRPYLVRPRLRPGPSDAGDPLSRGFSGLATPLGRHVYERVMTGAARVLRGGALRRVPGCWSAPH